MVHVCCAGRKNTAWDQNVFVSDTMHYEGTVLILHVKAHQIKYLINFVCSAAAGREG